MRQQDMFELRKTLREHFDTEAIRALAEALEIDYDSLGGTTTTEKIGLIVQYLQQRRRIDQLVTYIKQQRPDINLSLIF